MPAERRQVLSRLNSPSNGASVRPSRRRTAALPSANPSVDLGHARRSSTRSSAEFAHGLDEALNAGNSPSDAPANHTHHRSRPSLSRASRPQSVYQIVEAYRPLAYSIEKAEQEAKAAEKRRSLVPSPLVTTTATVIEKKMAPQPVPLVAHADDDAMDVDEFGSLSLHSPPAAPSHPNSHINEDHDELAVLRSPTRGKQQEECISGRGMLKRGYHIILDTANEGSEEARWAAIKRMEAQLRELDKSFTRVAPPSRRRFTSLTNHASNANAAAAPTPCTFSTTASRAAWNI